MELVRLYVVQPEFEHLHVTTLPSEVPGKALLGHKRAPAPAGCRQRN